MYRDFTGASIAQKVGSITSDDLIPDARPPIRMKTKKPPTSENILGSAIYLFA